MQKISPSTLLVVADAGRCRLFGLDEAAQLIELESLLSAGARQSENELVEDKPGRNRDHSGRGRHAMEPKSSAKKSAAKSFAKRVAVKLHRMLARYQHLIVVASPTFLGLLRDELDEASREKVYLEIDKDLTYLSPLEIHCSVNEALHES
jgi:protein required for attachment to host cells